MADQEVLERVASDPRYVPLVRERTRFAWTLSAVVVGLFMAFILVIALDKALLATPVGGLVATWGIPVGLGLILLAIASIALFTRRANRRWDPVMAAILSDAVAKDAAK
ncbi:DUF485 domain-containing protein [Sphingomonas sp. MG17]|uniref:DUF485 domain-containing protein n=1 Tax=Sphingomonas tagetis TaxID=2949092 RepID=A0A9X2HKE1_9SPHN|nr:DUF485 domain-containing protein [Sphingomonas tagetis]MCP3729454.1 DUF485 domain-containing protein [Sphingomonas tagetis]